jgi:AcrR family transcriptional regulator
MAKRLDPSQKIVAAALKLAARDGWHDLTLADIATAAKVPLPELARLFSSKSAILAAWSRELDAEVLKLVAEEDFGDEGARDRLFDVLMMRFDAMAEAKPALRNIARDLSRDPFALVSLISPALQSLGWMLEAADIDSSGLGGAVRLHGLALIWARVLSVWLDDGEDQAKTMAELDRRLRQAEDLLKAMSRFRNRASQESAA